MSPNLPEVCRLMSERPVSSIDFRYGGRLALRGDMDFGELSSAVLVATGAFDGARRSDRFPPPRRWTRPGRSDEVSERAGRDDMYGTCSRVVVELLSFSK